MVLCRVGLFWNSESGEPGCRWECCVELFLLQVPNIAFTTLLIQSLKNKITNIIYDRTHFWGCGEKHVRPRKLNQALMVDPFSRSPSYDLSYDSEMPGNALFMMGGTISTAKQNPCYPVCTLFGVTFFVCKAGNANLTTSDSPVSGWIAQVVNSDDEATMTNVDVEISCALTLEYDEVTRQISRMNLHDLCDSEPRFIGSVGNESSEA